MAATFMHRPLTPEERGRVAFSWRWAVLRAILGGAGRFLLWFVFYWLLGAVLAGFANAIEQRHFSVAPGEWIHHWGLDLPLYVVVWGTILGVPAYLALRGVASALRRARLRRMDLHTGSVDVFDLTNAEHAFTHQHGTWILLYGISGHSTLALDAIRTGLWPELLGLQAPDEEFDPYGHDDEDDEDNRPFGRESDLTRSEQTADVSASIFVLHRLPHSGRILRIESDGDAQPPLPSTLLEGLRLPERAQLEIERFAHESDCISVVIDMPLAALIGTEPPTETLGA